MTWTLSAALSMVAAYSIVMWLVYASAGWLERSAKKRRDFIAAAKLGRIASDSLPIRHPFLAIVCSVALAELWGWV